MLDDTNAATNINSLFNFTFAPGTTVDQMVGFETAGLIISNYLETSGVGECIDIYVETTTELASNIAGGAIPELQAGLNYSTISQSLEDDVTSIYDQQALDPLTGSIDVQSSFNVALNKKNIQGKNTLNVTSANNLALGNTNSGSGIEGYVVMNTHNDINWSYDYRDETIASNKVDWLSVAKHELLHNLGFLSGTDSTNDDTSQNNTSLMVLRSSDDKQELSPVDLDNFSILDLYRYNSNRPDQKNIVGFEIGEAYFSLDGGETNLANFAQGVDTTKGGDGFQGSHWKHSDTDMIGIMAPQINHGVRRGITALDLIALDVIGWNLRADLQDGIDAGELDFNLDAIVDQAEASIATRLGTDVTGMTGNKAQYDSQSTIANLKWERRPEVEGMITDSEVYDWTFGGGFWSNVYKNILASEFTSSSVDVELPNSVADSAQTIVNSLPETTSPQALLAEFESQFGDVSGETEQLLLDFFSQIDALADIKERVENRQNGNEVELITATLPETETETEAVAGDSTLEQELLQRDEATKSVQWADVAETVVTWMNV